MVEKNEQAEILEMSEDILDEKELSKPLTPYDRRIYLRKWFISEVESRVQPLREFKFELQKVQDDYCRELHKLERRYHEEAQQYYEKRDKIINGIIEPAEDIEAIWKEQPEEKDLKKFTTFYNRAQKLPRYYMGVPNFWLHIFTTSDTISQIVYEPDIEVLRSLTNVSMDYDNKSFTLEFHFKENAYFNNNVLTKKYFLHNELDEENELCDFEGFKIYKCIGCRIFWKPEKNLTVKFATRPNGRLKLVQIDSFFNFFNPPEIDDEEDPKDIDDETREILNVHFKIGNFFREEIIPKAFLYFIGEIVDDFDEEEDLNDSDEECAGLMVREDDKHIASVAHVLHKIHWN